MMRWRDGESECVKVRSEDVVGVVGVCARPRALSLSHFLSFLSLPPQV